MDFRQTLRWTEPCASTGILFITMVKDEKKMLQQWLSHYKACIDNPSFLIVDDGSRYPVSDWIHKNFPDSNISVFSLPPASFSDNYKSNVLSALAAIGVERFRLVISSDVDEIIFSTKSIPSNTLGQVLLSMESGLKAPLGVNVVQHIEEEDIFLFEEKFCGQRKYGFFHSSFTKPVIWAGAVGVFSKGQHLLRAQSTEVASDLALAHLKYVDFSEFNLRQRERNNLTYGRDQNPNNGRHWREQVGSDQSQLMFTKLAQASDVKCFEKGLQEFVRESCDFVDGRFIKNESKSLLGPVYLKLYC